jgi:hypothetical protein
MIVISTLDMRAQHQRGIVLAVLVLTNETNG